MGKQPKYPAAGPVTVRDSGGTVLRTEEPLEGIEETVSWYKDDPKLSRRPQSGLPTWEGGNDPHEGRR